MANEQPAAITFKTETGNVQVQIRRQGELVSISGYYDRIVRIPEFTISLVDFLKRLKLGKKLLYNVFTELTTGTNEIDYQ